METPIPIEAQQALFQNSRQGILITNESGEIIQINPEAELMFGYAHDELKGKKIEVLVPSHMRPVHEAHRENYNKAPVPRAMGIGMNLSGLKKDNTEFPVEISLSPYSNKDGNFVIAIITDITLIKKQLNDILKVQHELKTNEEKYRDLFENTLVAMVATDIRTFEVIAANEVAVKLFGYNTREAFLKDFKSLLHFVHPEDSEKNMQALKEKGFVKNREQEMKKLDGTPFWGKVSINVDTKKNIAHTIVIDITDRKKAELEIKQHTLELEASNRTLKEYSAQLEQFKLEMKDFAFVSSHHLQEPLRKILLFSNMLLLSEQEKLSNQGKLNLEKLVILVSEMRQKINDFLLFTRLSSQEKTKDAIDLMEILKQVLDELKIYIKNENATIEILNPMPVINGDLTMLKRLFFNLISNGIKFHRENVTPEIKISSVILPANGEESERVQISFEDNGIGISEKYQEDLFHIFRKLSNETKGTGIGLALSKKICTLHGGNLTVKSKEGEGSIFTVTLRQNQ